VAQMLDNLAAAINQEQSLSVAGTDDATGLGHAIAAGRLLLKAKASMPPGEWLQWLSEHCTLDGLRAQSYMRAARQLPKLTREIANLRDGLKEDSGKVGVISFSSALLLMARLKLKTRRLSRLLQGLSEPERVVLKRALTNRRAKSDRQVKEDQGDLDLEKEGTYLADQLANTSEPCDFEEVAVALERRRLVEVNWFYLPMSVKLTSDGLDVAAALLADDSASRAAQDAPELRGRWDDFVFDVKVRMCLAKEAFDRDYAESDPKRIVQKVSNAEIVQIDIPQMSLVGMMVIRQCDWEAHFLDEFRELPLPDGRTMLSLWNKPDPHNFEYSLWFTFKDGKWAFLHGKRVATICDSSIAKKGDLQTIDSLSYTPGSNVTSDKYMLMLFDQLVAAGT
jgi:hypothetical protein